MKPLLQLAVTIVVLFAMTLRAGAFETRAKAAIVVDLSTDTVLLEKNADTPLPPASMSKLMTLYMLFDAIRAGRVQMDTRFKVSSKARNMGGSKMFLDERDRPMVQELIQGIIVSSGNDAAVVVAEGLAGSEEAFARQMTEMAGRLGMTHSTFANASGWPHPYQRMSVRDLAILARHLIEEFPEFYPYFSQQEFDYKNRAPANRFNRNPLLKLGIGADGLKTGHTQEAGYGMVASAVQNGRRVIVVVSGLDSATQRAEETEALINWSFRQFSPKTVAKAGEPIVTAEVWNGRQPQVGLVPIEDVTVLLAALADEKVEAEVVYTGPLTAPIRAGDRLAELILRPEGLPELRRPLVADRDVPVGGFTVRVRTAAQSLLQRFLNGPQEAM
ncbi:D-alanyl-D-alanine carboxypeptidase family protein [Jhaorihella thermophila]|uniref:serine-type D-Ala-D-Ala carboxypeptidase n=1 Tax=Jhaorihella thermophila TaxID=488547 RepID=A0A1H5T521_9RHOB|nr:D-alanyl-D-alanine carboxypeptidase (penicillin-binding protein 5/6) [Jhaorihella thermophila]